ncbi:hypothetical protein SynNOUM97013_02102 [Synechococcus sp. NOUM97013]|nr:hypothetical protein SynNOUM97013_02102 [Synechococcus sp. NOUM97013]
MSCLSPGFVFGNDAILMQDLTSLSWWYLHGVLDQLLDSALINYYIGCFM